MSMEKSGSLTNPDLTYLLEEVVCVLQVTHMSDGNWVEVNIDKLRHSIAFTPTIQHDWPTWRNIRKRPCDSLLVDLGQHIESPDSWSVLPPHILSLFFC